MRKGLLLLVVLVCSFAAFGQDDGRGSLLATSQGKELGACPLKTTSVRADISGFLARVTVRQEFENRFTSPIEAVYVFPLSQKGAVDKMTMTVGTRIIRGQIMRREEARQTYETAKSEGRAAALLDQERTNVFTQSVANIMPGESVIVEISYVETLKYEDGGYEFVFPMTIGPRYSPGSVADAAKVTPPAATRAGHDISIEVNLNAGVPVEEIRSSSHDIEQTNLSPASARVTLRNENVIPNKDFVLRYDVTGKRIEDGVLAHRDPRGGFFTLILQPPDKIASEDRTPKEIVFVLDTSGSMSGFPIEKAKEAMKLSLDGLYPDDTFNLITFAGDTHVLFDEPVPATQANLEKAQAFLATREGGGGTEMMKAIKASLDPSDSKEHLRIVCFMTDAFVGNDDEIVAEIQKHPKARVFAFGIGNSVNRSLLDRMAEAGRGEVEYVSLNDDGSKAAKRFYERVRSPLLTDLSIDWNGMPVADVYPARLTDLFSAKPVIVHGRYSKAASGTIKLRGNVAGMPYEREIKLDLPESLEANDVLATLWARTRIDELTGSRLKITDAARGSEIDKRVEQLGLEFGLMTSFTSFVATEDRVVNQEGKPVTVRVPVEIPEGTRADLAKVYKRWFENDVAYLMSTPSGSPGGSGGTGGLANVSVSGRQVQQLALMSSGVVSASASQVVTVTGGEAITTENLKSIPTASRDATELVPLMTGINADFGAVAPPKPKTKKSGSGTGQGSGMGSASGAGSGPPPNVVSAGVINGKAVSLAVPLYPEAARTMNAQGTVSVQVVIDESGKVISAVPVAGHPLFRASATNAALGSTFTPTMVSGQAVKVTGVIVYNFGMGAPAQPAVGNMREATPMALTEKPTVARDPFDERLKQKLHSWLYILVQRVGTPYAKPAANEALFVREGKAELTIELGTRSAEAIEKLKAAGFDIVTDKGKTEVIGRIAVEKLAALAEIAEVKLILPKI
jgi:Ca-activated chloride channel homolog